MYAYNQLFKSLGLESEFAAFETVCNKKVRWDEGYLLAVASCDVVDINEKERCLQGLGIEIENCRKVLYEKLNLLCACITENGKHKKFSPCVLQIVYEQSTRKGIIESQRNTSLTP